MAYVKQLSKVGNSTALIIDRPLLDQLNLTPGADVEISVEHNALIIRPRRHASREQTRAALKRITARHRRSLEKLSR
jgi:antitoxin component of MazEF toxin-antitoxin module